MWVVRREEGGKRRPERRKEKKSKRVKSVGKRIRCQDWFTPEGTVKDDWIEEGWNGRQS